MKLHQYLQYCEFYKRSIFLLDVIHDFYMLQVCNSELYRDWVALVTRESCSKRPANLRKTAVINRF